MAVPTPHRSSPGRVLAERYELADLLGSGGMAEVRRAWDMRLHRHVAVKLFQAGSELSHERRFDNEIRTLASFSHPRLVQVHDAGTSGGTPFVVLQLVEGPTLRDRIDDEGPLAVDEVRRLGADLADALAYVHAMDVVHRDVKPSNILLDQEGEAHLADFGLARLIGTTRFTRPDQLVGTAAYLAPEQVRGEPLDQAVDVYALGLVLLECLTGKREFEGGDIEAAVARLHRRPSIPGSLPPDLKRLLTLMTSWSRRRRPTAADCALALRGAAETPTRVGAAIRRHPSHVLMTSVAVAVLATAGVSAALFSSSPPAESAPPAATTPAATSPAEVPAPATGTAEPQAPAPVVPVQVQANENAGDGADDKGGERVKDDDAKQSGKNSGKGKGRPGDE
ncbi:serine/threonine-protein kinase [Lentzea sp. E54]|uniref:serine/threonine-protein kinase n=1 Tax=Lentzea xerophila TaxID=3435883 RepID=UPI003DA25309